MKTLIVVHTPKHWPLDIPEVEVISSRDYLTNLRYAEMRNVRVFNLCRSYRYQSNGYYVSLLAAARGHKPLPDIGTLQDMRSAALSRSMSEDLADLIQRNLKDIQSHEFTLSIYFGRNLARRYDHLALKLYNLFKAPLLRASFVYKKEWELRRIVPVSTGEIPDSHRPFIVSQAQDYFSRHHPRRKSGESYRYDLAILHDPSEKHPPSDERALNRFVRAAENLSMRAELITRDDFSRIAEYDALFIRATTQVNHFTYQFARRAEVEGLAVIDDPESIIRCTNKVFLAEALKRKKIPAPRTMIVIAEQLEQAITSIPFPCVLKQPDSAFSAGVVKAEDPEDLRQKAAAFFEKTDLLVIQEFLPTEYDWRVGVLDGEPLYACQYHMAQRHWQIMKHSQTGRTVSGQVRTLPVSRVPKPIISNAVKAASLFGNGLYGVDLKSRGKLTYVIEVNDNPSIDAGYEDTVLGEGLYTRIMKSLLKRIQLLRQGKRL